MGGHHLPTPEALAKSGNRDEYKLLHLDVKKDLIVEQLAPSLKWMFSFWPHSRLVPLLTPQFKAMPIGQG